MIWPDTIDGDVFRRMQESNFDFSIKHNIDFNVDFENWPPPEEIFINLQKIFTNVEHIEPEGEYDGYITFHIYKKLTYELVMNIQEDISDLVKKCSGICESWGVMQD
ncbi:MAG: ribonuclease E inhibitor RraB [Proteobacteria bacterium]|nr:ribonuclease E inhibitor RraB [Pseudomonadota bacterium]